MLRQTTNSKGKKWRHHSLSHSVSQISRIFLGSKLLGENCWKNQKQVGQKRGSFGKVSHEFPCRRDRFLLSRFTKFQSHFSASVFEGFPTVLEQPKNAGFFCCLQFLSTSCLNINAMCLCHQAYHFEGNGKTKISCGLWRFIKCWLVNDRILIMCFLKDTHITG